jgi:Uma2 family endonuclease
MSVEPEYGRRKWTVDEVQRMVRAGILSDDEPVELLNGELVYMPPCDPPHAISTTETADLLRTKYGRGFVVREEKPVLASEISMPEPDVAVVRGKNRELMPRHPGPDNTVLVVEVAWSSQDRDHMKASIYAAAGFKVYWLLDVAARILEVHTEPTSEGAYRLVQVFKENATVGLPELPGQSVTIRDLLP